MRERKDDKQSSTSLPVYESDPPFWLPKMHSAADIGYAGFHPPRPGQDEDVLSETNVKNGFILTQPVSVETFSAQTMINENLKSEDSLAKLEELMNEVFIKRADHIPSVPPSSFRMPTRVTLNDAKRQAWFADLADPDVPLYKLGKSVPHGAKGHDLLDLLHTNNVAISRAVWLLRVFGANETAGLRNKPSYNPTLYSVEWANVVTSYIKKQLLEIALPSAPRPGLNIKQTFKGVLSDLDSREKWISRFMYCLKLLRTFYAEGLVDHQTFLVWIVQQMGCCNLAQAGFLTRLTEEYLDDILGSRALARPLVEACLGKMSEIGTASAQEFLSGTEESLKHLLQRSCLILPDAFIGPRMWLAYPSIIERVMTVDSSIHLNDWFLSQNIQDIRQSIFANFLDVRKRNEALLFRNPPPHMSIRLQAAVSDVKLLNSISSGTEMSSVTFFGNDSNDSPFFEEKLDMLLSWCVTPLQYGNHRPFAAVTLIKNWRDKACERATRRDFITPNELLQDQLFDWLDKSDVAGEPNNIRDVALLYGKLVKHELFSYASYIQRLIARGEPGLSFAEDIESRHRRFLSWIPLFQSTSSLINQRKVTLHGVRARNIPEDVSEREIRKEIRSVLPEVFGGDSRSTLETTAKLLANCNALMTGTRFEQVRTFRQWLLPALQKHIASNNDRPSALRAYLVTVELMTSTKCFHSVLDLTFCMLEHSTDSDSMTAVLDTFHRHAVIWACMGAMNAIVSALDTAHQVWKLRGTQSRPLLSLLIEFDNGRYLDELSRTRITAEMSTFTNALQPVVGRPSHVPDILPEILLLAGDPDDNAPAILANGLWIKYRMSLDWAWKTWDNTVASLRQVPSMTSDVNSRRLHALRYGTFLWRVDQHLPNGLDMDVLRWFNGPGKSVLVALSPDSWDMLMTILVYLVVHGALKTTTILSGLVYPAWELGAFSSMEQATFPETYLRAANDLCHRLLLQENDSGDAIPPTNLFEVQCLRTRRQIVYYEPHFPCLVASIPVLISLENNPDISEDLRRDSTSLRHRLCQDGGFRQGAYRSMDVVREAFENSPYFKDMGSEILGKQMIAGLRMILCDSTDDTNLYDWPEVTRLLSPWKVAATTIQMQFQIKQLGRCLAQDITHDNASANLDKLTVMLFNHTKTAEEAYYVGEMARGAGSAVVAKFIKNGLKCIAEHLSATSRDEAPGIDCPGSVAKLLRVLTHVSSPFRDGLSSLPSLDPSTQTLFFEVIHARLTTLQPQCISKEKLYLQRDNIILLARLLQFILNFRGSWSSRAKELGSDLTTMVFYLALHHATGENLDAVVYSILIDTLLFLYDEIPSDGKVGAFDPYRLYPDIPANDLPSDLPPMYRKQCLSLLCRTTTISTVPDLVNSHRDTQGNLVLGPYVVNRPWEWIENLEPSILDRKEGEKERDDKDSQKTKYPVKNSGSLSLDAFGARLTGDSIVPIVADGCNLRTEGNIRSFQDGTSSDSIFIRDWRETRLDLKLEIPASLRSRPKSDFPVGTGPIHTASLRPDPRSTPKASPASSIVSRSSAHDFSSSARQQSPGQGSHGHSNTGMGEASGDIAGASAMTLRKEPTSKRKATALVSDEVEIIEGPVPVRAGTNSKKAKVTKAPVAKAKAKRK